MCYIPDRSRGDCYTNYAHQKDKAANTKSGPLLIIPHDGGGWGDKYILLRGWCENGDPLFTPGVPSHARR